MVRGTVMVSGGYPGTVTMNVVCGNAKEVKKCCPQCINKNWTLAVSSLQCKFLCHLTISGASVRTV